MPHFANSGYATGTYESRTGRALASAAGGANLTTIVRLAVRDSYGSLPRLRRNLGRPAAWKSESETNASLQNCYIRKPCPTGIHIANLKKMRPAKKPFRINVTWNSPWTRLKSMIVYAPRLVSESLRNRSISLSSYAAVSCSQTPAAGE